MKKPLAVRLPCEYSQKNFCVCIKKHPTVSKHFEVCGKTFAVQSKIMNTIALERFVLYGS